MPSLSVDSLFTQVFHTIESDATLQDICNGIARALDCNLALIAENGEVHASVGALPLSRLRIAAKEPPSNVEPKRPSQHHEVEQIGLWLLHHLRLQLAEGRYVLTLASHRNQPTTLTQQDIEAAAAALIAASNLQGASMHRILDTMSQLVRDLERGTSRALEHHYWPRMETFGFRSHHAVQVTVALPRTNEQLSTARLLDIITQAREQRLGVLTSRQLVRSTSATAVHFIHEASAAAQDLLKAALTDCCITHSAPVQFLEEIPQALAEAETTLVLAEHIAKELPDGGNLPVLDYTTLPLVAWASAMAPARELLERSRTLTAALDDHPQLRETLITYLGTGSRIPATASRLYLHPNSVRYRIQRIEELCGVDLNNPLDTAGMTIVYLPEILAQQQGSDSSSP